MQKEFDIVVKNGRIIDGTGSPWFVADIGIANGRIRKMGSIPAQRGHQVVDAGGMTVAPGFIDLHNHTDMTALAFPNCESNIMQGITTAVVGNCGLSMAPVSADTVELLKEYLSPFLVKGFDYGWDWITLQDFNRKVEQQSVALNLVPLVGHGTLRIAVAGFKKETLSDGEMDRMKDLLARSLAEGAFGMSSGLIYPPGCYASTEELVELGAVLKAHGRLYTSHIRDEGSGLIESVEEAIRIGEENGIPVQISHLKAKGAANWGKVKTALEMMETARRRGVDVSCEVYPYLAGSTTITSMLPEWALEGGVKKMLERLGDETARPRIVRDLVDKENDIKEAGWEGIMIASCPPRTDYEGKTLAQLVPEQASEAERYAAYLDLIDEIKGQSTVVKFFIDESDVRTVLSSALTAVISDSWSTTPASGGKPHPRAYGTFPRVLAKYVRTEQLLTLEEAVRKMTSLPAAKLGLFDRGVLKEGLWADLVIFDPEKVQDRATYEDPHQYPLGITHVLVNGRVAVENGDQSPHRNGRILCSAPA